MELKVKNLKVYRDFEIIVKQFRNKIHCISPHLKAYQNEVCELLTNFDAFNIFQFLE